MIRTDYTAVSLCPPLYISAYRVNTYIEGTKSLADILNNCHVAINQTSQIQTTCSSHFCDKQQPHYWNHGNRGCGCWGVTGLGVLNIALMHKCFASDGVRVQVFMRKFSSTCFHKLFMTGVVPAPDGTIYLVDIKGTHYWGFILWYMYWGKKHSSE